MKPLFFAFMLMSAFSHATEQVASLRSSIESIQKAAMASQIDVVNYPETLDQVPSFQVFSKDITNTWPALIQNLEAIAPAEVAKTVVFRALTKLKPKEYVAMLSEAVSLCEQGKLSPTVLGPVIFPTGEMQLIAGDNYRDPVVIQLLGRAKAAATSDPALRARIDSVLKGAFKERADSQREFENIPVANLALNRIEEAPIRPAKPGESIAERALQNSWENGGIFYIAGAAAILAALVVTGLIFARKRRTQMLMKNSLITLVCLLLAQGAFAQQTSPQKPLKTSLERLIADVEKVVAAYKIDVFNQPEFLVEQTEFHWLERGVTEKKDLLEQIETAAPTEQAKVILIHACENLSTDGYLAVADKVMTLYERGSVSKAVLLHALFPPGKKKGIASDPKASALFQRSKAVLPEESSIVKATANTGTQAKTSSIEEFPWRSTAPTK